MPNEEQSEAQIILEVGDVNGTLATVIETLWDNFSRFAAVNPDLQFLYTKRSAIDVRLAEEVQSTDLNVEGEIADNQSQRFNHLQQMRQTVQAEIDRISRVARGSGVGASASGAITKVTPMSPAAGCVDPNAPWLQGSSFYRGRGDW